MRYSNKQLNMYRRTVNEEALVHWKR